MSGTLNFHADRFTAHSVDFTYNDKNESELAVSPFVTLVINGTDTVTTGYGDNKATVAKSVGEVTIFLKTVADAERIKSAVEEAIRNLRNLELEVEMAQALKEDVVEYWYVREDGSHSNYPPPADEARRITEAKRKVNHVYVTTDPELERLLAEEEEIERRAQERATNYVTEVLYPSYDEAMDLAYGDSYWDDEDPSF